MGVQVKVANCEKFQNYSIVDSGKFNLIVNKNGFFNASKFCKSAGKEIKFYSILKSSKILCYHLVQKYGNLIEYDTSMPKQHDLYGQYYHPILFLDVAMWCSAQYYIDAATIVLEYFNNTTLDRKKQLLNLLKLKDNEISIEQIDNVIQDNKLLMSLLNENSESDYNLIKNEQIIDGENNPSTSSNFDSKKKSRGVAKIDSKNSPPRHLTSQFKIITYAGFKLIIDKNGYFNASKFCFENNFKKIKDFYILDDTKNIIAYTEKIFNGKKIEYEITNCNREVIGKYFHPILFLKLACWLSIDFYEVAALIVLSQYTGEDVEFVKELTKHMVTDEKMEIGHSLTDSTILDKIKNTSWSLEDGQFSSDQIANSEPKPKGLFDDIPEDEVDEDTFDDAESLIESIRSPHGK